MSDLTVIIPSRGRPEAAAALIKYFTDTCTTNPTLVFAVDDTDPTARQYEELAVPTAAVDVGVVRCPSTTMVMALNHAARAHADGYAIGFMGDDHRPRTYGWDAAYLDALRQLGTGIVYGDDGYQGEQLPTQCAMTSDIVQALGFMAPPAQRHMFVDNFWLDLGRAAGCLRYLPDVLVEHLHPAAGKGAWDGNYARVNDRSVYEADGAIYAAFRARSLPAAVAQVRALMPHEWRLFPAGTTPEYTTPEWYQTRDHAPHLDQVVLHRPRLLTTASFVAQAAYAAKLDTVVDLGAGDGGLLSLLGPSLTAWGYDLMPANLEAAKRRGVTVHYGDVLNDELQWGGIAVCTEMLEHLIDPHAFVRRIADHASVLVCSSPAQERPGSAYEFHTWAWDLDGYRALVEQGGFTVRRQRVVAGFQVILADRT